MSEWKVTKNKDTKYSCNTCNERFNTKKEWEKHYWKHVKPLIKEKVKPVKVSKSKNRRNKAYRRKKPRRSIVRDKNLRAKKPGKRTSKTGNTYYESRANRSDKNPSRGL